MERKLANAKQDRLLWVDLEMTGLEAGPDVILEVAAIVTDWDFKELGAFEAVIHRSDGILKNMNEWCVVQHGASGLTERVRESKQTSKQVEKQLIAFVDEHFDSSKPVILAGNSIHIDRTFINLEWPELNKKLHYRMLDVTSWKIVFEHRFHKKFAKPEEHRALGDIRGSIEELQCYLKKVKL